MNYLPRLAPLALGLVPAVLGGCASWNDENREYKACMDAARASVRESHPVVTSTGSLVSTDVEAVTATVRERRKVDMRVSLLGRRAEAVARARCASKDPGAPTWLEAIFGEASDHQRYLSSRSPAGEPLPVGAGPSASDDRAAAVSQTNLQRTDVDEPDFVKNDSKYVYIAKGSHLRVIEAWPAANIHEVSRAQVPGTARKLFVHDDRAIVYSSVDPAASGAPSLYAECTYGYDCTAGGDGKHTVISIFDLTDKAVPILVRTIKTSSSLVAARRVGNDVVSVVTHMPGAMNWFANLPDVGPTTGEDEIHRAYDRAVAENDAVIDGLAADALLPWFEDTASRERTASQGTFYTREGGGGAAFTSVLSFDVTSSQVDIATIVSYPGPVYSSPEALYFAEPGSPRLSSSIVESSTIHKFSIGRGLSYRGGGIVEGRVLNPFSMDEKDAKLRVASSSGRPRGENAHSTLSILEEQAGTLATIGKVADIARGEDIRSVRFDGDRGYVVTFKKTDPLFAFDLSDPRAPRITGELKIPGFSTYIQRMDATHLLTIGYDAADQGDFAFFTGVLLQIFDVGDPAHPRLIHKEVIGTRGTSSDALSNHLAFTYFAPKNILALPMTICEGGNGGGTHGSATFSGLMVFDATIPSGFALRGKVSHPIGDEAASSTGCENWWTRPTSQVKRSIVMDDFVYSVSDERIKVNAIGALDRDVGELLLAE